jgi:hypothetical protein
MGRYLDISRSIDISEISERRAIAELEGKHIANREIRDKSDGSFPGLPRGVRLVKFEPKQPPVALDVCSIVTDVQQFVAAELMELDARLHAPAQIRAGHGVFTILERLRQVGVELAIDSLPEVAPGPDVVARLNAWAAWIQQHQASGELRWYWRDKQDE